MTNSIKVTYEQDEKTNTTRITPPYIPNNQKSLHDYNNEAIELNEIYGIDEKLPELKPIECEVEYLPELRPYKLKRKKIIPYEHTETEEIETETTHNCVAPYLKNLVDAITEDEEDLSIWKEKQVEKKEFPELHPYKICKHKYGKQIQGEYFPIDESPYGTARKHYLSETIHEKLNAYKKPKVKKIKRIVRKKKIKTIEPQTRFQRVATKLSNIPIIGKLFKRWA